MINIKDFKVKFKPINSKNNTMSPNQRLKSPLRNHKEYGRIKNINNI